MAGEPKDVGAVDQSIEPKTRRFLQRIIEELRKLQGFAGEGSKALTVDVAKAIGLLDSAGNPAAQDAATEAAPDLTKPPTPTGLTLTPGISQINLEWDAPSYTAGRGHGQTNIYAVHRPASDASAPPVFGDAPLVDVATGAITVYSLPSEFNTKWWVWIKWQSLDGVGSDPAGGTNGVTGTTSQDVGDMLEALSEQLTVAQLASSLSSSIALITAPDTTAGSVNARIKAEADSRSAALLAEATNRTDAIDAKAAELTDDFEAADAALSSSLTSAFTAADAATLSSAQGFTYARSVIDSSIAATLSTLRSEFAAADVTTLASAQAYTYSQATINSSIATSTDTLRSQLTGGYTGTDLDALTSGLLYVERTTRTNQINSLSQQITLLSAGAGEQFDYSDIWYFDSGTESWASNNATNVAVTAEAGWLVLKATTGTQTDRNPMSPDNLDIDGAKYPQVRARIRKYGSPTWEGGLWWTTTADNTYTSGKSVTIAEPSYDGNGIAVVTWDAPSTWTDATIRRLILNLSTSVSTTDYYTVDWVAVGRPSPGASSAQFAELSSAMAAADSAEVTARQAFEAQMRGSYTGTDITAVSTGLIAAERNARVTAVSSLVSRADALEATVNNATTGVAATATALDAVEVIVNHATSGNSALATRTTSLESSVNNGTTGLAATRALLLTDYKTSAQTDTAISNATTTLSAAISGLNSNRLKNSSFEVDADGDGVAGGYLVYNNGNVAVTKSLVTGRRGGLAQRLDFSAGTNTMGVYLVSGNNNPNWEPGKTYVISVYAYVTGGFTGKTLALAWGTAEPATKTDILNPALSGSWQRYAFRVTWGASVQVGGMVYITVRVDGSSRSGTIVFDDMMVTEGDQLLPYDGGVDLGGTVTSIQNAIATVDAASATATNEVNARLNSGGDTYSSIVSATSTANTALGNAATADSKAVAAQDAANTANTNANTALSKLSDIASDSLLTPDEKPRVIQDRDVIVAEQAGIGAQATAYSITTEKTAYDNAVTALTTYLATLTSPVLWSNLGGNTTIVGATFRSKFADVYTTRQALLNKIAANAKVLADAAQNQANTATSNAATAQGTADTAITNAATAQTAADLANSKVNDIAADDKFTAVEKQDRRAEWDIIAAEKAGIEASATTFGITTEKTTYTNAFQALATYLNNGTAWTSGVPSWISDANLGTTTNIVGATFRATWKAYYDARTALLNKVAANAKALADAAQSTANNANDLATTTASQVTTIQSVIKQANLALPWDFWVIGGQQIVTLSDGKVGNKALALGLSGSFPNQGNYIPIDPSKKYRVRFWARPTSDCNGLLYFSLRQFTNDTGTPGPTNGGRSPYKPSAVTRAAHNSAYGVDQWGEYSFIWQSSDWQAGAKFFQPEFLNNLTGTTGRWEIQDFSMEDATTSEALSASVQTEATTRASQTGALFAQYTVKTSVAGLVSGYGLASEANTAAPTSAFGIQAGSFFVAPAAVESATAPTANLFKGYAWRDTTTNTTKYWSGSTWTTTPQGYPFSIQTTPTTLNGVAVQPGMYVDVAFIRDGSITNAKIGNASIDDAKVANLSAAKLTVGDGTVGGNLKSTTYTGGSVGWIVRPDGFAEFSNIVARGAIYASTGTIGGSFIGSNYMQSTTWVSGSTGWRWNSDGTGWVGGIYAAGSALQSSNFVDTTSGFQFSATGIIKAFANGGQTILNTGATGTQSVLKIGSALDVKANGSASFAGALSAATGTFAGALSAATGTFSGALTADAVNAISTVNIQGQSVIVPVAASISNSFPYTANQSVSATIVLNSNFNTSINPAAGVIVIATGSCPAEANGTTVYFKKNGTTIDSFSTGVGSPNIQFSFSKFEQPGSGTHTYSVESGRFFKATISLIGAMK